MPQTRGDQDRQSVREHLVRLAARWCCVQAGEERLDEHVLPVEQVPAHGPDSPRGGAENLALEFVDRGVHGVSLRFAPTVHGAGDHGFIAAIAAIARRTGVSGYPGDGTNRWAAVHRSDAAHLVALSLEKAPAGARVHAVAEKGVPTREIAEAIGRTFDLPVTSIAADDVPDHFGWIGAFFAMDLTATSAVTQELLGWTPAGPTLIEDLDTGAYSAH